MTDTNVSLASATRVWARIGLLSFGGPAAQIALMHSEIVERHKWQSEQQFLNALSFCMLLPGPEAMQMATYAGWRMHGTLGGLIAGALFVIPGAIVMLVLAGLYAAFGNMPLVDALFLGVKAAVIVIVLQALLRVAKRALAGAAHWAMAALAFIGLFFFDLSYPLIVVSAAVFGFFCFAKPGSNVEEIKPLRSPTATLTTIGMWLVIWWAPLLALRAILPNSLLNEIGLFFSKLAVVTFGGAYAVLAYMGQDAVQQSGWLTAGEMMDGLGLAETTPGPLILVTEFVGFLAAHKQGGFWFGTAAAFVTLWATFIPCFLWIFAGAPYIDWLATQPRLTGALSAITAAVVGVILNLSIWFALNVFFENVERIATGPIRTWAPDLATLDWRVCLLALGAALGLFKLKLGMPLLLGLCALAGVALSYL